MSSNHPIIGFGLALQMLLTFALQAAPISLLSHEALRQTLLAAGIPQVPFKVIRIYPNDASRFTQGLALSNGRLWISRGLYRLSSLDEVDVETGKTIRRKKLPDPYFAEGITLINTRILQLTYKEQTGFIYDAETLSLLSTFHYEGEGWGLTHTQRHLLISHGSSNISYLSLSNYKTVRKLRVKIGNQPLNGINDLEYIENTIFANVLPTSVIIVISAQNGQVIGWLDIEKLRPQNCEAGKCVANGITFNPKTGTFFVTGKYWPSLYELSLFSNNTEVLDNQKGKRAKALSALRSF